MTNDNIRLEKAAKISIFAVVAVLLALLAGYVATVYASETYEAATMRTEIEELRVLTYAIAQPVELPSISQISAVQAREIATDFISGVALDVRFFLEDELRLFAVEVQTADGARYTLYIEATTAVVVRMDIGSRPMVAYVPLVAPQVVQVEGFLWPLPGHHRISSNYGHRRHPITGRADFHAGIDIPAPTGTAVVAARSGWVALSRWNGNLGYTVVINHSDGFSTRYGHNSALLVEVGQWVNQGEMIARVGSTGVSTGPHLHFEIRQGGSHLPPLGFFGG